MHFFWGGDMPHYSPPLPFRRGRAGARACWPARGAPGSGVAVLRAVWRAQARAPGRCCVRARWPAGPSATPAPGAARLRTGGEEESARTGDSNPGCNFLVRGCSPSMHFFWGGDMPHYSPPLPFRRGRAGCPCVLASRWGRPARGSAPSHPLGCDSPAFLASLCSPFSGVFQFLDRYISLARKIGYVTIKPMTNTARYLCFSWLMCNRREKAAWPAITVLRFEKNWSTVNVQKGQISVLP